MSHRHDRCFMCRGSRYHVEVGFTKPVIVCSTGCGNVFTAGKDGEPYFSHATNTKGKTPRDFVAYYWEDDELKETGLEWSECGADHMPAALQRERKKK